MKKPTTPNGRIIYKGKSELDGSPIVVIAIGFKLSSKNAKTGNLIQTYILRDDLNPLDAIKAGADASICGDCVHRGRDGKNRTCYVNVGQGAMQVYKSYVGGGYPVWDGTGVAGRLVRLGTYGDPAAVPAYVWGRLLRDAVGHTGYTHQWRNPAFAWLSRYAMASADTETEAKLAQSNGWRTFRVALPSHTNKIKSEAMCPASEEAGKKLTCDTCLACNGVGTGRRGSIVIQAHGGTAVMANVNRLDASGLLAA